MWYWIAGLALAAAAVPWGAWGESAAPPALYGTDALGRTIPTPEEAGPHRGDRYVGIFYFLWLQMDYVHDVSAILKEHPNAQKTSASPPWGPHNTFHFWGEPLWGYYRSDDPWVLRRHAALLADAGVDFLVFDTTNAVIYEPTVHALCAVFREQQALGEQVPRLVFMTNTQAGATAQRIFDAFYKSGENDALWFHWQGKPLMICDPKEASADLRGYFTLRKAHWPFELVDTHNAWHWEATYPQVYSYDEAPDKAEQVNVSVGQNLHQDDGRVEMMSTGHARGRSFHEGRVDDRPAPYLYGFNFGEQWRRALALDPEVVFVTGWNEWVAMQLKGEPGPAVFCDQYNLEFSRDVEMMRGGYGDNYYMQLAANIRRFKGAAPSPPPSRGVRLDPDAGFAPWDAVTAAYRDHALETLPRDHAGCGEYHYEVRSGRNDFVTLKAAHDADCVHFYAETRAPISPATDNGWMWLFIDVKHAWHPDWEGFNFVVNRQMAGPGESVVEVCTGGWQWKETGKARYQVEGERLHVAVPKAALGIGAGPFAVEFKWIDNMQAPGDVMDVYTHGDAAPGGRFRYRFAGK